MKLKQQLQNTKGRFFTLQTKFGDKINAKFVSVSPCYATVYDNNAKQTRKFALTSITLVG